MRKLWILAVPIALSAGCVTGVSPKEAAQTYYDLGNAYAKLGEEDKATTAYLHALELDGTLFQASYNLARAYIETRHYAKATALLNELLARDPQNTITLDTLGYDYYKQNELPRSLGFFQKVLAISPADSNALFNVAVIYERQKNMKQALAEFDKLFDLTSDYTVLPYMGRIEIALGNRDEGIRYLQAYLQKKPGDFAVLVTLGEAYEQEKRYDRALAVFATALALKPHASEVLFDQAFILLTAIDDADGGMKALSAAVDAGFKDPARIKALLASPELVDPARVRGYLSGKGLLPPHAAEGAKKPVSSANAPPP